MGKGGGEEGEGVGRRRVHSHVPVMDLKLPVMDLVMDACDGFFSYYICSPRLHFLKKNLGFLNEIHT